MRVIDAHTHVLPSELTQLSTGKEWYGFTVTQSASGEKFLVRENRRVLLFPGFFWLPAQRLAYMDSLGVDVHLLSPWSWIYNYQLPVSVGVAVSRACNNHIAEMVRARPDRFVGLASLPMQDVSEAIVELDRDVTQLGLRGAIINDHVNGKTYDAPEFSPFWRVAEQLGALIMFHQCEGDTVAEPRSRRYDLGECIGSLSDRAITFATLVFGGVLNRHPQLKLCLCHGGGYACFGAGRMDRGWQVRTEARVHVNTPPSSYLRRCYYDCITHSESSLRFIIDTAGADRVFMGSDWPCDMGLESPVQWIMNRTSLTQGEKEAILGNNLENLLGI
jgi:aminocarboxymuconate-semialdehyde decarboxylase